MVVFVLPEREKELVNNWSSTKKSLEKTGGDINKKGMVKIWRAVIGPIGQCGVFCGQRWMCQCV